MFKKILFTSLFCRLVSAEVMPYYTDQEAAEHMAEYSAYHVNFTAERKIFLMDMASQEIKIEGGVIALISDEDEPHPNYMNSSQGYAYHPHIGALFSRIKSKLITEAGYDASNLSPNQQKLIDFRWEKLQDYLENAIMVHASRNEGKKLEASDITMDFLMDVLQTLDKRENYKEFPLRYCTVLDALIPANAKNTENEIEKSIRRIIECDDMNYKRIVESKTSSSTTTEN